MRVNVANVVVKFREGGKRGDDSKVKRKEVTL